MIGMCIGGFFVGLGIGILLGRILEQNYSKKSEGGKNE